MGFEEIKLPGDTPSGILTLRMIISGKDVGLIIGKGGQTIKSLREDSGAKIYINDGSCLEKKYIRDDSCPQRIITVIGAIDAIIKVYALIYNKMEEREDSKTKEKVFSTKEGVTLHLVLPSCQCGSLIGKGGNKIKEIREKTGASLNIASGFLPGSTERSVRVGGSRDAVTLCVYHICCVVLENPTKGTTVQYQPGKNGLREGHLKRRMGEKQGQWNLSEQHDPQEHGFGSLLSSQVLAAVNLI